MKKNLDDTLLSGNKKNENKSFQRIRKIIQNVYIFKLIFFVYRVLFLKLAQRC